MTVMSVTAATAALNQQPGAGVEHLAQLDPCQAAEAGPALVSGDLVDGEASALIG